MCRSSWSGTGPAGEAPVLAVVHAGRPGVASGVVPAAVARMRELGAAGLSAWIGPSVCGRCYEVPEDMRDDVAARVPAAWCTTSRGTPGLDLPAAVRSQLQDAGVRVEYSGGCTLEDDQLFSYRRDPNTGRFAGLVWTGPDAGGDRTATEPMTDGAMTNRAGRAARSPAGTAPGAARRRPAAHRQRRRRGRPARIGRRG